ncbi:hypothetical protein HDU99_010989 [Rhizoclosmatium hyalinum]|nr:hypothetical protein HDU99_010989 [Rhizoclosmatium hyalinum]
MWSQTGTSYAEDLFEGGEKGEYRVKRLDKAALSCAFRVKKGWEFLWSSWSIGIPEIQEMRKKQWFSMSTYDNVCSFVLVSVPKQHGNLVTLKANKNYETNSGIDGKYDFYKFLSMETRIQYQVQLQFKNKEKAALFLQDFMAAIESIKNESPVFKKSSSSSPWGQQEPEPALPDLGRLKLERSKSNLDLNFNQGRQDSGQNPAPSICHSRQVSQRQISQNEGAF